MEKSLSLIVFSNLCPNRVQRYEIFGHFLPNRLINSKNSSKFAFVNNIK